VTSRLLTPATNMALSWHFAACVYSTIKKGEGFKGKINIYSEI